MTDTLPAISPVLSHFGEFRSLIINGKHWFVALDICKVLGLTNTAKAIANITSSEVGEIRLSARGGRPHKLVSEAGLYELALQSRKPNARAFRHFISAEVMPSLVKYGVFAVGQGRMTDEELRQAFGERSAALIAGTRDQRYARIAASTAAFTDQKGRPPNAKERFFLEKP